ncbi:MAG TPA: TetR/AcrR family transcriptional regulator [Firmicutes bacterium]|nr:TetR/AcrR family transcriptional regulator [Bacillota bacterium]HOQ23740.1 TetR/AcrR family transcriptional regulator [Bacillota bacterium]HPT66884.1 TetR/AcrR family transcriptional regulator [Bacillota bacterium]
MARTDEKKERIIRVALSLFGQAGYDGTTVEEIAQKAEIAKGTVYLYYTSKDAIYRDLIVEAGKARRAYLSQSPREDGNVRLALARLITQELRFARAEKLYYRLLSSTDRNEGSEFSEEIRRIRREFLTELIELIRVGMLRGAIREGNPVLLGQLLAGMVRGAYQMLEENSSLTVDQIVLSILDLLWRGWAVS